MCEFREIKCLRFPSPLLVVRSAAKRPNSIKRVFSGWTSNVSWANRSRRSCRKSSVSWYIRPAGWQRSIRACVEPSVKVLYLALKGFLIVLPCHRIDSCCSTFPQGQKCSAQKVDLDIVQKRSQLLLLVPFNCFSYAVLRMGHSCPALRPDRVLQFRISLAPTPCLHQLRLGLHRFFAGLAGTMGESNLSLPCILAFAVRLLAWRASSGREISRFPNRRRAYMPGSPGSAEPFSTRIAC